jgi:hypothetical protein
MPVRCSVRECKRDAIFFMEDIGLCPQHMRVMARLVHAVQDLSGGLAVAAPAVARAPQEVKAPQRPAAVQAAKRVARKRLKTDAEIEEVVSKRLEKAGSVLVASILGMYAVDRGSFKTASERVVSVMSKMVERDPARLELSGSGAKAVLRLRQPAAPSPESQG